MKSSVGGNGTIAAACRQPPAPADADAVARGRERLDALIERAEGEDADRLAAALDRPEAASLLDAVFGNSPFLSACLLRAPGQWADLVLDGPDRCLETLLAALPTAGARLRPQEAEPVLRQARNRAALVVGLADLSGAWDLDRVLAALSAFADAAIGVALESALAAQASPDAPRDADPAECGFVLLAMGKLGAGELNYSSDVDLIALYEAERLAAWLGRPTDNVQQAAVRATQGLTRLLQDRTRDGYVFRTDLRLRPDPGATQIALPAAAAISYYESYGQNWERAAMIKARPCAGDMGLGRHFLNEITPFVWRRSLDFAAIADIMAVKRQIHSHKGHGRIAAAGHDVKVGRGGIREIEFFAQTQQLIAGGREPDLRLRGTVATLHALAELQRIDPATCREMEDAYRFLRIAEHRLQMIDDQQTQKVPAEADALARYATFMGFPDSAALEAALTAVLTTVSRHFDELYADADTEPSRQSGSLVFTGTDHDPDTLDTLSGMGFGDPETVSRIVRDWHRSRYPALKTRAARERLTGLMPDLLAAFAATPNPDLAFKGFDEFLSRMPAGIQLFALLLANRSLLGLLAEIMGGFPDLARHLSRYPILFDAMLDSDFYAPLPDREALQEELQTRLSHARHEEDVLRAACRWVRDRELQTGIQALHGMAGIDRAMGWLTDIADCALDAALTNARTQHEASHGRLPGGQFAVLAMGRLGCREMLAESDLDLVFVYDHAAGAETSDGPKPLTAGAYYARLSQRLISAVTAMTPDGRLYEVDMRLRPSGKSGPVATRLEALEKYYDEDAQTWELMALTKARPVCGDDGLTAALADRITTLLTRSRDAGKIRADAAAMRLRMRETHRGDAPWDLKHGPGGLADMDFIWQSLALSHPATLAGGTRDREPAASAVVSSLVATGVVTSEEGEALTHARALANTVMIAQRLAAGRGGTTDMASPQFQVTLARAAGSADFAALHAAMDRAREAVLTLYSRVLGDADPA